MPGTSRRGRAHPYRPTDPLTLPEFFDVLKWEPSWCGAAELTTEPHWRIMMQFLQSFFLKPHIFLSCQKCQKCAKAFMLSEQNIRYLVVPFVGKVCWCTRNYAAGTFKRNNSARLTAWLSWVKEETRETLIFLIIKSQGCLLTSEKSSAEKKTPQQWAPSTKDAAKKKSNYQLRHFLRHSYILKYSCGQMASTTSEKA